MMNGFQIWLFNAFHLIFGKIDVLKVMVTLQCRLRPVPMSLLYHVGDRNRDWNKIWDDSFWEALRNLLAPQPLSDLIKTWTRFDYYKLFIICGFYYLIINIKIQISRLGLHTISTGYVKLRLRILRHSASPVLPKDIETSTDGKAQSTLSAFERFQAAKQRMLEARGNLPSLYKNWYWPQTAPCSYFSNEFFIFQIVYLLHKWNLF